MTYQFVHMSFFQFRLHSKMVTVYDHIEKSMLPQEYLPDDYEGPTVGTLQDVIGTHNSLNAFILSTPWPTFPFQEYS